MNTEKTITGVFLQILTALNNGGVINDLDESIREVTAACAVSQAKGKLSFAYVLNRPFKIIEDAFRLARADIEEKTGHTVHIGTGAVVPPPSL
jgi:hypothetical protein